MSGAPNDRQPSGGPHHHARDPEVGDAIWAAIEPLLPSRVDRHPLGYHRPSCSDRATFNRNDGVRYLMAAYDLNQDKLYGHIKTTKNRTKFLEFCRCLRTLYPPRKRDPSCPEPGSDPN